MDAIEAIMSRRSIRRYTGQDVTEETVEQLLRAAMAAPSTIDNRDWAFVVVRERDILNQIIANQDGNASMLANAPLAIVVCGDLKLALQRTPDYWVQDCALATENILIAAQALGLGAVYLGTYPVAHRVEGLKKILNLPEHIVPLTVLSIGYPAMTLPKEDRYEPEKIHYDRW
ncbi:nitroreductase family protein [Clostridia bacterium OttesenSCG-928-F22]|nr:nitroreductase family protein [Clostridia bacterium OttesenSCG-928-F22]